MAAADARGTSRAIRPAAECHLRGRPEEPNSGRGHRLAGRTRANHAHPGAKHTSRAADSARRRAREGDGRGRRHDDAPSVRAVLVLVLLMLRFAGEVLFRSRNFLVMFLRKLFDVMFLVFFFLEVVPAHERIRFSSRLRFFMLCFHEPRRQCRQFLFAEAGCAVAHFTLPFFFLNFLGRSGRGLGTVHGCFPKFLYPSRFAFGLVVR